MREKLIELLYKGVRCPGTVASCDDCQYRTFETPCDEFGATADMLIANGVTIQKWIPVTERLPTEDDANETESILAINKDEGYVGRWIWDIVARYPTEFTHWMPLPEPPKGE